MGVKIRDIFTFDHVVKGFCSVGEYIIDAARYICDYLLVCKCPERFPQVPKYRQRKNPPPAWKQVDGLCELASPPGLEPRMTVPKTVVLPITPWGNCAHCSERWGTCYLTGAHET